VIRPTVLILWTGSIAGPYRQYNPPNTFSRCHTVSAVSGGEETYTRALLSTGNGYALWQPFGITDPRPKKHLEEGVSIGDVGLIDQGGDFCYLFNIFASSDDPLHELGVPQGFEPLQIERHTDIRSLPEYFPPRTVISSTGVDITKVSDDPLLVVLSML